MSIYYTWLDVKKEIDSAYASGSTEDKMEWPSSWKKVDVYRDELVITLKKNESQDLLSIERENNEVLTNWFGHHYSPTTKEIVLDFKQGRLAVSFENDDQDVVAPYKVVPLFKEWTKGEAPKNALPGVPVIGFHSFKGGVGRTLSLVSYVRAYSEQKNRKKLLIIDSDLEAPGLTWMAEEENIRSDMSFLDALSILHETMDWRKEVVSYIGNKIKETELNIPAAGRYVSHYFLPAYRYIEQIMQIADISEKMVRMKDREWIISEFLSELGAYLGVEAVLLDLRAGFSEISAPLLFDPRVKKVFVTSTSLQSRKGLLAVLNQIYPRVYEKPFKSDSSPKVIITMVPDEIKVDVIMSEFINALSPFNDNKLNDNETTTLDINSNPDIEVVPFASSLIHLDGFASIDSKLSNTRAGDVFSRIVSDWFPIKNETESLGSGISQILDRRGFLQNLQEQAEKMATAESGQIFDFLATSSLRNIAQKYRYTVPGTVILGAKGSGKTFAFLQMLYKGTWEHFLESIYKEDCGPKITNILPFVRSKTLIEDSIVDRLRERIDTVNAELDFNIDSRKIISNTRMADDVEKLINSNATKGEWRQFWIESMIEITGKQISNLSELNDYLLEKEKRLVFMIDGLEEMFKNVAKSDTEKSAIAALSQDVIAELRSIPNSQIGLLLFLRRDIALNSIEQNWTQFYNIYSPYELRWSKAETLLLVLWLCRKIDVNFSRDDYDESPIEKLTYEILEKKLYRLWGLKLGGANSREANSANWILLALSDLNEQLQARDIIRFLTRAAELSIRATSPLTDRYLTPESIRKAIEPCSTAKIEELKQEIPNLAPIFEKLGKRDLIKQIPFDVKDFDLSADEVRLLEQQGFLIDFGSEGYYMPEIIRLGLGFKLERGARPKVVALLNRAKSRI